MQTVEPFRVTMMDEPTSKDHWSTSEVARELGVSPSLVRTWIAYMNWEVRRNAEGHRIFTDEDVAQLRAMKAWVDEGNSLKEFRRERQGEGEYDPRLELRNGIRRLRELQTQQDAMIEKQRALLEGYLAARREMQERLEAMRAEIDLVEAGAPGRQPPVAEAAPTKSSSEVIHGVLKQLLSMLLEQQGKLQLVAQYRDGDRTWLEYQLPNGRKQVVEDLCQSEADRRAIESMLRIILAGGV